jgi:hypothetical protein
MRAPENHPMRNPPATTLDHVQNISGLLRTEKLTPYLFKASLIMLLLGGEQDIVNSFGGLLFLMAFSLSRSSGFRTQNWTRRYNEVERQLLSDNRVLSFLSENSAKALYQLIYSKVRDGLDVQILFDELSNAINQSFGYIPQMVALINQAEFKGMAPLQLIGRGIAERTEIPWENVFSKCPILQTELTVAHRYLKFIKGDKFPALKYGGISQDIKNLQYFCVRCLIVLGGEETLRNYAGVGGDNAQITVPMKVVLTAIIEKMKDRQAKIASEISLDDVDGSSSSQVISALRSLAAFSKGGPDTTGSPFGSDNDDDDEDDDQPGPSVGIPLGVDEPDMDIPMPDPEDDAQSVRSSISQKRSADEPDDGPPSGKRIITSLAPVTSSLPIPTQLSGSTYTLHDLKTFMIQVQLTPPDKGRNQGTLSYTLENKSVHIMNHIHSHAKFTEPTSQSLTTIHSVGLPIIMSFMKTPKAPSSFGTLTIKPNSALQLIQEAGLDGSVTLSKFMVSLVMFFILVGIDEDNSWDPQQMIARCDPKLHLVFQVLLSSSSKGDDCLKDVCETWTSAKRAMICVVKLDLL